MKIMTKKTIISLISLMTFVFSTAAICAEECKKEDCSQYVKTQKEAGDLEKCLQCSMTQKRKELIEKFKKIRKVPAVGESTQEAGPTPTPQPTPNVNPKSAPVQPTVPAQPATPSQQQAPHINYNY
jgi:hypothetical protein